MFLPLSELTEMVRYLPVWLLVSAGGSAALPLNLPLNLIFLRPEPAFCDAMDVIWDLAALL